MKVTLDKVFKLQVHETLKAILQRKIETVQNNLLGLKQSAANETKSTAGDKHETALAMLQIEQANNRGQLQTLLLQKEIIDAIDISMEKSTIGLGTLVETNKGCFYISIAQGKIITENHTLYSVSVDSPIGALLLGKQIGDHITVHNTSYNIIHFV
jgi:hypothetical protein